MQDLAGSQAAQPRAQLVGAADGLLPTRDPVLDHQRRRVVGRTRAVRVHRQLEVKNGLARDPGPCQTKKPTASRVTDTRESQPRGVGAGVEQPQGRLRTDHAQPPGRATGVVPIADRKSTRLNSSHVEISYAVFCLKKKKQKKSRDKIKKKKNKESRKIEYMNKT